MGGNEYQRPKRMSDTSDIYDMLNQSPETQFLAPTPSPSPTPSGTPYRTPNDSPPLQASTNIYSTPEYRSRANAYDDWVESLLRRFYYRGGKSVPGRNFDPKEVPMGNTPAGQDFYDPSYEGDPMIATRDAIRRLLGA